MDILPWIAFILAFISLPMLLVSRDVKKDAKKTKFWMMVGVVSTLTFMIWALFYSGWE